MDSGHLKLIMVFSLKSYLYLAGANRFYKEFEKLGGHTFIKELGINPLFLQEDISHTYTNGLFN